MSDRRAQSKELAIQQQVQGKIVTVGNKQVILDTDLAVFYGVPTGRLNEQAKKNAVRFPADFRFQLTSDQAASPYVV